jgi:adenylate cyclase
MPREIPVAARRALSALAAFALLVLANQNLLAQSDPLPSWNDGTLHVGDAVVGNVGSSERMNYTALGATINLAARLEGLNKNYGTRVLASAAVKAGAEHRFIFRSVDRISPKGFAEAVAIHELGCAREGDVTAELAFCRRWDEVYASLEHDDPASALAAISAFLSEYPGDSVARYYAEHIRGAVHSGRPRSTGTGLRKRAR